MQQDYKHPITPPPPHLLKKFSAQAQDETKKRNGAGYLKTFATLCIEWATNCQSTSNDRQIRSSEIEPPPELVEQWTALANEEEGRKVWSAIAAQAAQWGADQELEACCQWFADDVVSEVVSVVTELRAARRPKIPSLKEQALGIIDDNIEDDPAHISFALKEIKTIRRALEALPND